MRVILQENRLSQEKQMTGEIMLSFHLIRSQQRNQQFLPAF